MMIKSRPQCGLPDCGETGVVRCGQCKAVWYCSPLCREDHWAQHSHRCRAPPPLEYPGLHTSSPLALSDGETETKKTEVTAPENSRDGYLANEDAVPVNVKEISDDDKIKSMEKVGVKKEGGVQAAPEVDPPERKMKTTEEKQDATSLYPGALASDKISSQKIPAKMTEVLWIGSVTSPTEFSINLAVQVRERLELHFLSNFLYLRRNAVWSSTEK